METTKKGFAMLKKLLSLALFLFSFNASAQEAKPTLYYFYANSRCSNCIKFEQYTEEVSKNLPVEFQKLNIEEPENAHFVEDYQLYTKSVVISDNNGKYKNLTGIWQNVYNKDKFMQYITDEVNAFTGGK